MLAALGVLAVVMRAQRIFGNMDNMFRIAYSDSDIVNICFAHNSRGVCLGGEVSQIVVRGQCRTFARRWRRRSPLHDLILAYEFDRSVYKKVDMSINMRLN